ncbi:transposase [Anaerosolibacter carboniphilus]|uniref:Transposase n=1 Tax=Anaerosolibacter carboniphilus TaxID=1417629 RepID=A0A841KZ18_9FIRM|nr:helix-turn-helix domain-containing protein [Anaerosolibacter carboniphilus]MBB6219016.1 transposase [Anaerosolibacter carboniphilus]
MTKYGSRWTQEEVEYLIEKAGSMSLEAIAKRLKRPFASTVAKADELGVANGKMLSHKFTLNQFSKMVGVAASTVCSWTEMGLEYEIKKFRTTFEFKMIDIRDFYTWGEQHQDILDTRKFKLNDFGNEPEWLKNKRRADRDRPPNYTKLWAKEEEAQLISYHESGLRKEAIAELLGRSISGIQRKMDRLKIQGLLPIDPKGEFYTQTEIQKIIQLRRDGMTFSQIGKKICRSKSSVWHKYRELQERGLVI